MAEARRKPDVAEDLAFERAEWRATAVLSWALLLLVASSLLGLFGNGPLSRASIATEDGALGVHYERFGRFDSPMRLTVLVRPDASGTAAFTIASQYLEAQEIEGITPTPLATELEEDGVRYVFRAGGTGPVRVTLDLRPERRWRLDGAIRAQGRVVRYWQFIYP